MDISKHESTVASEEVELYYCVNRVEAAEAAVILVHGINEHCGRYDEVVSGLNHSNYTVYRYDHRGHGRSGGKRGDIQDYLHLIEDADKMVEMASRENPGLPLFMLGHSMGGFISACYGILHGKKLNGQILTGAPTSFVPPVEPLKEFNYREVGDSMIPNELTDDICRDPEVVKAYGQDPLVNKEYSMMLMGEVFVRGTTWLIDQTPSYDCPCLLLHGGGDKIVPAAFTRDFHDRIASTDKSFKIYEGLYHEIMNEPEKEMVMGDICGWIKERI